MPRGSGSTTTLQPDLFGAVDARAGTLSSESPSPLENGRGANSTPLADTAESSPAPGASPSPSGGVDANVLPPAPASTDVRREEPAPVLDDARRALARGMLLQRDRTRISVAFDRASIPHAFVKGALVDALFFDGRGEREACDVDVLVPRDREHDAWRALVDLGWARYVVATHPATNDASKERLFHRADGRAGYDVDLHVGLLNDPPFRDFAEAALARRRVYETSSGRIPGLCPEDMLVHIGGNVGGDWITAHGKLARDAALILDRFPVDLAAVAARARRASCDGALWAVLELARDRHAARVPAWLSAELAPSGPRRAGLARLLKTADVPAQTWRRIVEIDWPLSQRPLYPIEAAARWALLRRADRSRTGGTTPQRDVVRVDLPRATTDREAP